MNTSPIYLKQLARHLLSPIPETQAAGCGDYQTKFPLFITDELAGYPVDELYPEIACHLDLCPACLQEYIELAELTTAAMYGEELA